MATMMAGRPVKHKTKNVRKLHLFSRSKKITQIIRNPPHLKIYNQTALLLMMNRVAFDSILSDNLM